MANLLNVMIKPVPLSAQKSVTDILKVMLGPDAANKINTLLEIGGFVLGGLNEQAADVFASKLRDAGATVSTELSNTTLDLFRVRLLSFGLQRIAVIKQVRDITGLGLKEARELVDQNGVVKDNLDKPSAVKVQQKLSSAGATAVVEAMSGTDSDEDPKNPEPLEDDSYLVKGKVSLVNGEPAIGLLVRAYDKDLRSEQYLGEASTLTKGEYAISYKQEQFSRSEKNNADLLLRVFNEVGVEMALKTKTKDGPDIFFNSPKKTEIDLQIEDSAAVKASEYERLEILLSPALDGVTLADLSLQDINFLINEAEINEFSDEFPAGANSIHFIAQSAKLSRETNISAAAFYGWARLEFGLVHDDSTEQRTLNLDTLLEQSDKYLKDALEQAIAKTIIPVWLIEQIDLILSQLQSLRDQKVQQEKDLWVQRNVKAVLIDAASAEPLVGFLVDVESSTEDGSLESLLDLQGGITNRQGELVITYTLPPESVISTLSLVLNIKTPNGDALGQQEISFAVGQTQAVTVKITLPTPVVPGETLQINALPMSFSDGLSAFLERNNLTNIAELRKLGNLERLEGLPETLRASDELKQLQAHVDLSLLSTQLKPEDQILQNQFLIQKGFTHFITIADTPIEQFVSIIGEESLVPPEIQYAQASYLDFQLNNLYLDTQTGVINNSEELQPDSALSCQCEDCVSALSPGAYLTDLIGYVTKHVQVTDNNNRTKNIDLDFLVDNFHQPLSKLPINCEATKTQLRQIRIACEVLLAAIDTSQLNFVITDERVARYRQAAYQSLLRNIGTSQFDIDRASSDADIEAIANRLGVAPKYVEKLRLQSDVHQILANALSEHNLERIFGLPAYMETYIDIGIPRVRLLDPLRFLKVEQKRPELYDWRLEHLKKQWKETDFPESPLSENMPTIDPDVIGPDDFRHPNEINTAFQLWKTRREWVNVQIARIHNTVVSDLNKPNGLEDAIKEIYVPSTIPITAPPTLDDLIAQQALLINDAKIIEDAAFTEWLTLRYLSIDALAELARFATDVKTGKEYNEEEWQTYVTNATNIIVNSVKRATYDSWLLEEANISLNMTTFWPSLTEPKEGEWSLLLENDKPLLDPEKVEPKDLPDGKFGLTARTLWNERRIELDNKQKEYADILKSKTANRLDTIMIGAFGTVPDIESINTKLNSLDQTEQSEAKAQISALNIDQEGFVSLVSASLILKDDNQTLSDTTQNNLSAALVSAHKLNFLYSVWTTEEGNLPYWQSLKARLPKWRASQSQRQQWQQALKQASTPPLIDPDTISGDMLLEPVIGNFAFDTWRSRTKLIDVELNTIRDSIEQGGNVTNDVINPSAIESLFSEEKYLGISQKELIALSQLEEEGIAITSRLQQLALARDAYSFLLDVAKRIEKGSKILASTRENMYAILLQVWKVKQFATWGEEEKNKLALSPEFFRYPAQRPAFTTQQEAQKWRTDTRRQREWYRTLKARIGQQETLVSSLKAIVSDVEEQTLPLLRDALINVIDSSSDNLPIKAENLTKRFLIDLQQSGCQMTTRVSMALEVLQTLVFSIRSGKIDIAGVELVMPSNQFEQEWRWMGSYATWKAAMGVFLYPEQILLPTLARDRTPMFDRIVERLRNRQTTPELEAENYATYLTDIANLTLEAACRTKLNYKHLNVVIGRAESSRKCYFGMFTRNNEVETHWEPLPNLSSDQRIIGMGSRAHYLYLFSQIGESELLLHKYDSQSRVWEESVSVALPEEINTDAGFNCVVMQRRDSYLWDPVEVFLQLNTGEIYKGSFDAEDSANKNKWELIVGSHSGSRNPLVTVVETKEPAFSFTNEYVLVSKYAYRLMGKEGDGRWHNFNQPKFFNESNFQADTGFAVDIPSPSVYIVDPGNGECMLVRTRQNKPFVYGGLYSLGELETWMREVPGISLKDFSLKNAKLKEFDTKHGKTFYGTSLFDLLEEFNSVHPEYYDDPKDSRDLSQYKIELKIRIQDYLLYVDEVIEISGLEGNIWQFIYKSFKRSNKGHRSFSYAVRKILFGEGVTIEIAYSPQGQLEKKGWLSYYKSTEKMFFFPLSYDPSIPAIFQSPLSVDSDSSKLELLSIEHKDNDYLNIIDLGIMSPYFEKIDRLYAMPSIKNDIGNLSRLQIAQNRIGTANKAYLINNAGIYLEEAWYRLPLFFALYEHQRSNYALALDWYKVLYDINQRTVISYALKQTSLTDTSFVRDNKWLKDPLSPHAFAQNRKNTYTHFTVQSIIRCLLDYADSEFTFDTSESVAKARSLYQTALDLIQLELPPQPANKCLALIETLRYTVADPSLQPYYDHLKLKLSELTSTEVLKSTLVEVLDKLNSNLYEEKRLANALKVVQVALGKKKASLTATDIIAKSLLTKKRFGQILLSDLEISTKFSNMGQLLPRLANLNLDTIDNNAEIETVATDKFNEVEIGYTPRLSYEFCIPNNPTAKYLLLRAELNLFKIRNCMNIAGMHRELEPYSASIDVESALPSMGAGGQINLAGATRIRPTQYRYPVLVDRAKQLTNLAQQTEASFFSTLQSLDQEKYSLFKARQDIELSREGVKLQKLRVRESEDGVGLAELQLERTSVLAETYAEWSSEDMLDLEKQLLDQYKFHQDAQVIAAFSNYASHIASLAVTAAAGGYTGAPLAAIAATAAIIPIYAETVSQSVLATSQYQINRLSQSISIALRNREYELQHQLAEQDLEIGNQQIKLANDRVYITEQEQAIAEIQSEQASDNVIFLQEKFTNVELYDWMSGVLQNIFRYYLQQASSISKLAEIQLAFERQEPLFGVIKDDYYELPNLDGNQSSGNDSSSIDRRGLTGSARLLRDITKLDQYAFTTDQRKQQLNVNFSLSQLDPFAFQQFKQTGVLNFDTSGKVFDRRFPGQYLRLIKQVRISVIALIPPVQGISATLTSSGISRVVIAGDVFQTVAIRRDPESIAFTNPIGASGVFELNPNPEMLFPFEGNGVDTRWEFRLPKASNPMDFNTIADVLLTIEYTALHNRTYQEQVQRELDSYTSFDRAFSFRQEFSDAWYDLHNPEQTDTPMSVNFATTLADFPSNVKELSIASVLMYFIAEDDLPSVFAAKLLFTQDGNTSGGEASPIDGVIRSNMNGTNWASISGRVPEGNWQLELPNVPVIKQLFKEEKIIDILLFLTCEGELPSF